MKYMIIPLLISIAVYTLIMTFKILLILLIVIAIFASIFYIAGYLSGNKKSKRHKENNMKKQLLEKQTRRDLSLLGDTLGVFNPYSITDKELKSELMYYSYKVLTSTLNKINHG